MQKRIVVKITPPPSELLSKRLEYRHKQCDATAAGHSRRIQNLQSEKDRHKLVRDQPHLVITVRLNVSEAFQQAGEAKKPSEGFTSTSIFPGIKHLTLQYQPISICITGFGALWKRLPRTCSACKHICINHSCFRFWPVTWKLHSFYGLESATKTVIKIDFSNPSNTGRYQQYSWPVPDDIIRRSCEAVSWRFEGRRPYRSIYWRLFLWWQ